MGQAELFTCFSDASGAVQGTQGSHIIP